MGILAGWNYRNSPITLTTPTTPQGIVDIVAPWNYPFFTALNGLIPALLAGNAVCLTHRSTPLVGEAFQVCRGQSILQCL